MKTATLIFVAIALAVVEARADFDQANVAFAEKRYGEAASNYETVIRQQGFSVPVLFNLGNTYQLDGKLGRAIVNYERAQLLAPRASDVAGNLNVARHKAGIPEQPAHWLSADALSCLGSLAAILIAAGLLFRQITGRGGLVWIAANGILLLAVMVALLIRSPDHERAIVIAKSVPVYIAPVTVTQPLFTLTEGQPVSIWNMNGDFLLVDAGAGRRGWVATSAVERITPM